VITDDDIELLADGFFAIAVGAKAP